MAAPPPPALMDDAVREILLRLPPGDPACLVRASLVCKPWRCLLSDGAFLRRYHAFHRTPPMLGFFNQYRSSRSIPDFVRTTKAPLPIPNPAHTDGYTLDRRHGRVLLQTWKPSCLTVWDPITGDQQILSSPIDLDHCFAAAVLCASDGCDHLECSGGPFLVAVVGIVWDAHAGNGVALGSIYSSKTGVWCVPAFFDLTCSIDRITPSLLAKDGLYFTIEFGVAILKYDLVVGVLSVISMPPIHQQDMCLVTAEDGGLGVAAVQGHSLHLWSRRTDPDGVAKWVCSKVIELDAMVSVGVGALVASLRIVGFAEGSDTVFIIANDDICGVGPKPSRFISTNDSMFSVELKSGRIKKICKKENVLGAIFPFMSFYTPASVILS